MTKYLVISSFLNFVAALLVDVRRGLARAQEPAGAAIWVFSLSLAIWSAAYFFVADLRGCRTGAVPVTAAEDAAYLIPVTYLHFV